MHEDLTLAQIQKEWHGSLKSYAIGFAASLILSIVAFFLVAAHALSKSLTMYVIISLAAIQAIFQLRFFLHVGQEAKPRWESVTFAFMLTILLIVVAGTMWIMYDLNDRTMTDMSKEMPHD